MKVVYSIKVKVKNYQLDLKGFFNLSGTMKFVPDFCHGLRTFKLSERKEKSTGNV